MNSLKKFLSETPLMVMVYTGCIFFMHLAYGMNTNMLGPAMIDMKYIYDTTDLVMFYGVSISATGYTIGSFGKFLFLIFDNFYVIFSRKLAGFING